MDRDGEEEEKKEDRGVEEEEEEEEASIFISFILPLMKDELWT